jgi:hypothetical protein
MNKVFIYTISGLVIISGVFGGIFYRDVLSTKLDVDNDSAEGCIPFALEIKDIKQSSFSAEWETKDECSGYLVYGESIDGANRMVVGEDSLKKVRSQQAVVDNLLPDSTYYFYIVSGDVVYGDTTGLAASVNTEQF